MSKLFGKSSSTKLWGSSSNQTKGEIDLRAEIKELLFGSTVRPQRGHWIIYRRFDINTFTDKHDEVYNTGVGDNAHPYVDTLIMTRRDPVFAPEDNEKSTPMGILEGSRDAYYFEYDVEPKQSDQIFEVFWDDHTVKPVMSQLPSPHRDKYNIKEAYPYRMDSGRIEYWTVFVNKDRISY